MTHRFYDLGDLVKADCHDCHGCYSCCEGMGDSIRLDPYDAYQFEKYGGKAFEQLINEEIVGLTVWEGMILPCMQMNKNGQCALLDENGRCSVHDYRPGICRLFPLGRNYEDGVLSYFLLDEACPNRERTKSKVKKLIGVEPAWAYHEYLVRWHDFRWEMVEVLAQSEDEEQKKQLNMYLLQTFFLVSYDVKKDFYEQVYARMERIRKAFD
ncbi:MAG: YkgJ family cysteine cluster protein [bacterium]|nr:YkgJ family cysteine cluster protein [bacterium]